MQTIEVSTRLPDHWRASSDPRGVVIDAVNADGRMLGSVTVCEQVRGFALGVCGVPKPPVGGKYVGRGWKQQLYADAVAALEAVLERQVAQQHSV